VNLWIKYHLVTLAGWPIGLFLVVLPAGMLDVRLIMPVSIGVIWLVARTSSGFRCPHCGHQIAKYYPKRPPLALNWRAYISRLCPKCGCDINAK
jgi:predicted RNA-binding Zn-ribbon protein involved in translation (DUF1610 family)